MKKSYFYSGRNRVLLIRTVFAVDAPTKKAIKITNDL